MTILPFTFARLSSKNFVSTSLVGCDGTVNCSTCAVTGPLVPGVHASASVTSESLNGAIACTESFSLTHPGCPNDHGSRCAFFNPQRVVSLTIQSCAAFRFGEPVRRGP